MESAPNIPEQVTTHNIKLKLIYFPASALY